MVVSIERPPRWRRSRAASEMAAHEPQRLARPPEQLWNALADELVRGAVKAVPPHAMVLVPLRRDPVAPGVLGHLRVELALEGRDQRNPGHPLAERAQARQ